MRFRRRVVAAAVTAALATAAGCSATPPRRPAASVSVDGDWTLRSATDDEGPVAVLDRSRVTLVVDGDEAFAGTACNGFRATLRRDGAVFDPTTLVPGSRDCPPALRAVDDAYRTLFRAVDTASVRGGRLVLTGGGVVLTYVPTASVPVPPLERTVWRLDGLVEETRESGTRSGTGTSTTGPAASFTPLTGAPGTLRLDAGRLVMTTACGTVTGPYTVAGDRLTAPDLRLRAATPGCDRVAAAQVDVLLAVLQGPAVVTITVGGLALRVGPLEVRARAAGA